MPLYIQLYKLGVRDFLASNCSNEITTREFCKYKYGLITTRLIQNPSQFLLQVSCTLFQVYCGN